MQLFISQPEVFILKYKMFSQRLYKIDNVLHSTLTPPTLYLVTGLNVLMTLYPILESLCHQEGKL